MRGARRRLLCGAAATLLGACATRAPALAATATAVEQRSVSDFDEVLWSLAGELFIEQGERERLSVEAEPALLAKIVTEVRQRRLVVTTAPGSRLESRLPIRVRLETRALRRLDLRGSAQVRIGRLAVEQLALDVAGSVELQLAQLTARRLDVDISGSADIAIGSGRVDVQRVAIVGAGTHRALDLASRSAEISIDGSGDVRVAVADRLAASIGGSGDIRYRGEPQVSKAISGAGSVTHID